jgi:predicted nicotinamide N-methyase
MECFRGYPLRRERPTVGARAYELLMPADSNELLDDPRLPARFAQDEYLPYWAALWPAALLLADVVAGWPSVPPDAQPRLVLELGCGLGLVGLVAADRGYRVIMSDYDEDALAFAEANARGNGLSVETRRIDWRRPYPELRADRILAADVLYEARSLEPVARFVAVHLAPDGLALLADANRSTADPFPSVAQACGLTVTTTAAQRSGLEPGTVARGRLFKCSSTR